MLSCADDLFECVRLCAQMHLYTLSTVCGCYEILLVICMYKVAGIQGANTADETCWFACRWDFLRKPDHCNYLYRII